MIVHKTKINVFFVENCPHFDDENLSETFSAEMEFCKIDPRATSQPILSQSQRKWLASMSTYDL
jgi:hypothetical protein